MKIACITDDGKTISQHFGRAEFYKVFTIDDKKITAQEMRPKIGHNYFAPDGHEHHHVNHGNDPASHDKHTQMADSIKDCEAVICGGMGNGAYQSMLNLGIKPVVTDNLEIDEAVEAYIKGELIDHVEKLH